MHRVIVESLEEYLAGELPPGTQRTFEAHLDSCDECRREVTGMLALSDIFEPLRPTEAVEPQPGFYFRLMEQVKVRQTPSFWSLLALNAAFGRKVVFASLLTLAVLGSFLISRETRYAPGPPNPESVLAVEQNSNAFGNQQMNRDRMLVTLTSYNEP